ncbi:hypothetical protein [Prevotella sp. KH2C16]|uniref:hypothetical protein n=1 Tax=Prevotella sp. KH2C16 TaxID=1855325 RepID=UPI0008E8A57F|nr:hypothetical protein [Prevotella sp. KH2C16]SFG17305.1 hypothetical protein SAMN05216383_10698 [Prevotella sp. KH2C16]
MKLKRNIFGFATLSLVASVFSLSSCTTDDVEAEVVDENLPQQAVFDFTNGEAITGWGLEIPGGSSGTPVNSITTKEVTLTTINNGSTPIRIYSTGSGVLDLRSYSGDILIFSVPEGYIITGINWSSANESTMDAWSPSFGTIAGGIWTAPTDGTLRSVSFTATGTTRMNVLTVTYEKGSATLVNEPPTPEPPPTPESPTSLSFDFTSSTAIISWGFEVPGKSEGVVLSKPITEGKFTITPTNAAGATEATSIRFYTSKGGATDLRIYTGDTMTYSVPENYVIKELSWTSANAETIDAWTTDAGTLKNGVWTGEAGKKYSSIKFTATGTTRIDVLTVTYQPAE